MKSLRWRSNALPGYPREKISNGREKRSPMAEQPRLANKSKLSWLILLSQVNYCCISKDTGINVIKIVCSKQWSNMHSLDATTWRRDIVRGQPPREVNWKRNRNPTWPGKPKGTTRYAIYDTRCLLKQFAFLDGFGCKENNYGGSRTL